jgi:hypothetical protein
VPTPVDLVIPPPCAVLLLTVTFVRVALPPLRMPPPDAAAVLPLMVLLLTGCTRRCRPAAPPPPCCRRQCCWSGSRFRYWRCRRRCCCRWAPLLWLSSKGSAIGDAAPAARRAGRYGAVDRVKVPPFDTSASRPVFHHSAVASHRPVRALKMPPPELRCCRRWSCFPHDSTLVSYRGATAGSRGIGYHRLATHNCHIESPPQRRLLVIISLDGQA